jgi:repressor LexA
MGAIADRAGADSGVIQPVVAGRAKGGGMITNEGTHLVLSLRPAPPAAAQLAHEMTVAEGLVPESSRGHARCLKESLDLREHGSHAPSLRCVAAHCQGVLQRDYRGQRKKCETAHMAEPMDELQRVRIALRRVMARKGIKNKPLAKKAGLGETSVRDILDNEDRDIKLGTLHKLAGALEIDIHDLIRSGSPVPLVGRIGAGGEIVYEETPAVDLPRPPGAEGVIEALEVQGSSMLPRYSSGDVVFISAEARGVDQDDIGEFCAVRLVTGETYVKQLAHGSKPGFFNLRSLNADDIVDVEIEWATPILFVMPRAARRRLGV